MKVSGFTFVRNALTYDYPVVESITSILPLCDEFVVCVGNSDDGTRERILSIGSPKIRILDSVWDDSLRQGGRVLAVETDKALSAISPDSTWGFYLQADEVVHEQYLDTIAAAMKKHAANTAVDGLLFHYRHFFGSYDYTGESYAWYRREIRVVRNRKDIYSYQDAQGFRKKENRKLRVKLIDASIYHYGWVKRPDAIQGKMVHFSRYWHDDAWIRKNILEAPPFDYGSVDALSRFTGTHPQVMHQRIAQKNWTFTFDLSMNRFSRKERIIRAIQALTGCRFGEYKNYKII